MKTIPAALAIALSTSASSARADQLWIGLYQHDVTMSETKFETGQDIKAGWIGDPIESFRSIGRPALHLLVSKSLNWGTNYVAAGLNWTFGTRVYVRPGIGLSVNDGPSRAYREGRRVDLGSPVTFEPELALGWRATERVSLEASWVHLSHATIFSRQNRGIDSLGVRALLRLP
jgi:lipid A 3-O-deacylase